MHSAQAAYRRFATPPFAVPDPDRPGIIQEVHVSAEAAMRWYWAEMPVLLAGHYTRLGNFVGVSRT